MVEKNVKQCFQKHTNSASKKCWEKIIVKKCKIVRAENVGKKRRKIFRKNDFYILTNIVTKAGGGKTRQTIFPETHE